MAIRYDMHMHSSFSTDSDTPMQAMADAAVRRGLQGICLTEHMDLDYPRRYFPDDANAFSTDPEQVFAEIQRLRDRYTRKEEKEAALWIGFGLEFGMQPHLSERFHRIAVQYPLDFIIASQHLVCSLDPYYPDSWENTEPEALIGQYYEEMLTNLKNMKDWDTLGHLDYIIRYIPGKDAAVYDSMAHHEEIIDEILRYVISCGKCLEVNTAGYKYHLTQPHPAPPILKRYRELGGSLITIGADAHEPGQIALAFDQAQELLRFLGFNSYCVFENRRMRQVQL